MPDYSNPSTPLTGRKYTWSVTLTLGPARPGSNPATDRTGSYAPPPGATVGTLLDGIRNLHARECGVPVKDVVLVRYSLSEK
ncbi:hypothetical protein OG875_04935 [Streptomyces sp. NBC_01498]|uniref:hypothetical protein n=1 Tax=Streptomyces sp. NBC_01498 TaxID=2975870 RepID=UPI002E7AEBAB|nr:hypothetical protein [Streptomyces sp. NBC_01498]WTL24002.1 hypothetical protein OG875_04935 [Streptomyces sp. NBC_01498]